MKASKVQTKRRAVEMEVVGEQARTERVEHKARVAQLDGDLHKFKGKLDFLERRKNVADSRNSMLSDECNSQKRQISRGSFYKGNMALRLANGFKNVDVSIDDSNCHAAHAQKAL